MKFSIGVVGAFCLLLLQACQPTARTLDINGVMDRTIDAIVDFTKEAGVSAHTSEDQIAHKFTSKLHSTLNGRPKVFSGRIGLVMNDDASFKGFDDLNKDNRQDEGEQHLFTIEVDAENERLIATDFSDNTYGTRFRDGQYQGYFFVWVERRQSTVGVSRNRFAGRNIETRMKPVRSASRFSGGRRGNARRKARSGGARSGK